MAQLVNPQRNRITLAISIGAALTTVLWLISYALDIQGQTAITSSESALQYLQSAGPLYYFIYINALFITLFATCFMACLFLYCQEYQPNWSVMGVAFIPVYSLMNIFAYGSQVSIVPQLLKLLSNPEEQTALVLLVTQLMQAWQPISIVAIINNAAYAVLGIPSIIFGWILFKEAPPFKWPALLLLLNGVACILGIIGIAGDIAWLAIGGLVGGFLFLVALFFFIASLLKLPMHALG